MARLGTQQKVNTPGQTFVRLSQWPKSNWKKLTKWRRTTGKVQCLISSPIMGTTGGLLVWHVRKDHRIWSCRKPPLTSSSKGHLWARAIFLKEAKCQRILTVPKMCPLFTSTHIYPIRGCLCGCRCTAPGSVQSSPAPTFKDACITFWKGRLAGNASCITS